jgi:hypothetical protein
METSSRSAIVTMLKVVLTTSETTYIAASGASYPGGYRTRSASSRSPVHS